MKIMLEKSSSTVSIGSEIDGIFYEMKILPLWNYIHPTIYLIHFCCLFVWFYTSQLVFKFHSMFNLAIGFSSRKPKRKIFSSERLNVNKFCLLLIPNSIKTDLNLLMIQQKNYKTQIFPNFLRINVLLFSNELALWDKRRRHKHRIAHRRLNLCQNDNSHHENKNISSIVRSLD